MAPSRVKELAEAEAARAEAETPDEGEQEGEQDVPPPDEQEGEPEQEGEQPPTPSAMIPDTEAFEREAKRHEKALAKMFGPELVETMCQACDGLGYVPPWATGSTQPPAHDDFRACHVCEGWGVVATGSMRPGNETRDCPKCAGRGYLERQVRPEAVGQPQQQPNGHQDEYGTPSWMGDPAVNPSPVPSIAPAASPVAPAPWPPR